MTSLTEGVVQRVEKHRLKPTSPYYLLIKDFCHKSKNLYNHANFLVRQKYISEPYISEPPFIISRIFRGKRGLYQIIFTNYFVAVPNLRAGNYSKA